MKLWQILLLNLVLNLVVATVVSVVVRRMENPPARYELRPIEGTSGFYRMDKRTGEVWVVIQGQMAPVKVKTPAAP